MLRRTMLVGAPIVAHTSESIQCALLCFFEDFDINCCPPFLHISSESIFGLIVAYTYFSIT